MFFFMNQYACRCFNNMNKTSLNGTCHRHEVGIETNQNKIEMMKTKLQIQKLSKGKNLNEKMKTNF